MNISDKVIDTHVYDRYPYKWTGLPFDKGKYHNLAEDPLLCSRCQMMVAILSQTLLSSSQIPCLWTGLQFRNNRGTSTREILKPGLESFLILFGCLSLRQVGTCELCAFVRQIASFTLGDDVVSKHTNVTVILNAGNIGIARPIQNASEAHKSSSNSDANEKDGASCEWRKALRFSFLDNDCAELLPPTGTVFVRDHDYEIAARLERYSLAGTDYITRIIDADGIVTRQVNDHINNPSNGRVLLGNPRLRPDLCDVKKFAGWLKACKTMHGDKCTKYAKPLKYPIRLLNTSTLDTETFTPDLVPEYFTLSYVWGSTKYASLDKAMLQSTNTPTFRYLSNLHPSVFDAIRLTQRLGKSHIWIDSLCIVQDSDQDKLAQVYQMDAIYAKCSLTLIAAGDNPEGLPGVVVPRNSIQTFQNGGLSLVLDSCTVMESHWMDHTVWSSRAWTLQEYILSHRRLIFTKDQVYWYCQKASWRESIQLASLTHTYEPLIRQEDMPISDLHTTTLKSLAAKSEPKYVEKYDEIVQQYSGRKLTKQEDRLFAFQGVLNAIQHLDERKIHFWALTTFDFELELDWSDLSTGESQGEYSSIGGYPFPSWSWLSYPGPVATGSLYAAVICFRFSHDDSNSTGKLRCERISSMRTHNQVEQRKLEMTIEDVQREYPGIIIEPSRQIMFWTDVVSLGIAWTRKLDFRSDAVPLSGLDNGSLSEQSELEASCCLWAWSDGIDKTQSEYDFISINYNFRENVQSKVRSIWLLDKRNGVSIRAGHGIIAKRIWNKLVKRRAIVVLE